MLSELGDVFSIEQNRIPRTVCDEVQDQKEKTEKACFKDEKYLDTYLSVYTVRCLISNSIF